MLPPTLSSEEIALARQIVDIVAHDYKTTASAVMGKSKSHYMLRARYAAINCVHEALKHWTDHELGDFFDRPPHRIRLILDRNTPPTASTNTKGAPSHARQTHRRV